MGSWPDRYRKLVADLPRLAASARTTACLTSTCVDARVLLADAPAGPTGDAQADDLLSILRGRAAAGIGGEIICDWPGGPQWLENTLPVRRAWGDNGWSVLQAEPRPGEQTPGETTRLGGYAARVWGPLLAAEEID